MVLPPEVAHRISEDGFDPQLSAFIQGWASTSGPFSGYLDANRLKISKKLRTAKEAEDQRDVGLELYTAYSLLSAGASVIYEPRAKGPDLLVSIDGSEMYVETRRVREREATVGWVQVSRRLRREVEPHLRNQYVFLGIIASDHNYIWRGISRPSLEVFLEKYEETRAFILAQVSSHQDAEVRIPVDPLPEGFAKLTIRRHPESVFCLMYPEGRGDEPSKLLRIACEKSRQVVQGHVNLIVVWIDAGGETCDDFESVLSILEQRMHDEPALFPRSMRYESPSHAAECWQACSAFLVRDVWRNEKPLPETGIPGCSGFLRHDCGQSRVYENLRANPRLPNRLLDLIRQSARVPFESGGCGNT